MKKTLITLLALTGVAMGANTTWEWETLTLTTPANGTFTPTGTAAGNTVINWSQDTRNLTSWKISFDLSVKQFSSTHAPDGDSTLNNIFGTMVGANNSGAAGYVLSLTNNGGLVLTDGKAGDYLISSDAGVITLGNGTEFGTSTTVTLSFINYVTEDSNDSVGGIFTLTVGGGEVGSHVVTQNDTDTIFGKNGNTKLWTNGQNQYFTNIAMAKGGNIVVPEPTTATLSLLALAGLAARRRRK